MQLLNNSQTCNTPCCLQRQRHTTYESRSTRERSSHQKVTGGLKLLPEEENCCHSREKNRDESCFQAALIRQSAPAPSNYTWHVTETESRGSTEKKSRSRASQRECNFHRPNWTERKSNSWDVETDASFALRSTPPPVSACAWNRLKTELNSCLVLKSSQNWRCIPNKQEALNLVWDQILVWTPELRLQARTQGILTSYFSNELFILNVVSGFVFTVFGFFEISNNFASSDDEIRFYYTETQAISILC